MKTRSTTIGAFEAKNTFSELLDRVRRGTVITITKHDRPVARLVPAKESTPAVRRKATDELRALSKRYSLKGVTLRELAEEGRC